MGGKLEARIKEEIRRGRRGCRPRGDLLGTTPCDEFRIEAQSSRIDELDAVLKVDRAGFNHTDPPEQIFFECEEIEDDATGLREQTDSELVRRLLEAGIPVPRFRTRTLGGPPPAAGRRALEIAVADLEVARQKPDNHDVDDKASVCDSVCSTA